MNDKNKIRENDSEIEITHFRIKKIALIFSIIAGTLIGVIYLSLAAYNVWTDIGTQNLIREHFAALIGLPTALIGALCIVIILENTSGPIEFEALGFKFKGASGPIILWIMCFLAIVTALKLCW